MDEEEVKAEKLLAELGITEAMLDQWDEQACEGVVAGEPGPVMRGPIGRPRFGDEPLKAITVTLPVSMIARIDAASSNRSAFIREAVARRFAG